MRARVAVATRSPGSLLATREIVDGCTFARAASSLSVTGISPPPLTSLSIVG